MKKISGMFKICFTHIMVAMATYFPPKFLWKIKKFQIKPIFKNLRIKIKLSGMLKNVLHFINFLPRCFVILTRWIESDVTFFMISGVLWYLFPINLLLEIFHFICKLERQLTTSTSAKIMSDAYITSTMWVSVSLLVL